MKEESIDNLIYIGTFVVFLAFLFWIGDYVNKRKAVHTPVFTVDTVTQKQIDTVVIERKRIKYIYEKQIDTIYMLDSVGIDSAYTATIKRLDSLEKIGFFER
jgi:hypothetical protein